MKNVVLSLIFSVISVSLANAQQLLGEVELGKDEIKVLNVISSKTSKILVFRWTLYKDNGLVIHINYDKFPHQSVLYKDNLNSYKVSLSNLINDMDINPYIIIYFVKFNTNTNKATFRYYLFNSNANIEVVEG